MDKKYLADHIEGSLINAMIGDSMGSATENMSKERIVQEFGGKVTKFYDPLPNSPYSAGREAGEVTDDTTIMLEMIDAIVDSGGKLRIHEVVKHLLKWAEQEELFKRFAGPSTKKAIQFLKEGKPPKEAGAPVTALLDSGATNGAAVKAVPVGLAYAGDLDAAIEDTITMCIPTHNTNIAYSGASAVATAVAEALKPNSSVLSVVDAAIYGAEAGDRIGRKKSYIVPGASVIQRIKLVSEIAISECNFDKACDRIVALLGCGLHISEAVPVAIGVFVAARGDPNLSVVGAVNMGGDTDSIAAIVGAISGAFAGIKEINVDLVKFIIEKNKLELKGKISALTKFSLTGL